MQSIRRIAERYSFLRNPFVLCAAAIAAAILLPFALRSGYLIDIADDMIIWSVLTVGLNVVVGLAGLLDLGYIAFFAIGGYTFGVLGSKLGATMWESMPIAAALVLIASVIIGIPTLRLKSDYLAIMTLGFGQIIFLSVNNLNKLTGGPNGLYDMPPPTLFGLPLNEPERFYWFLLALLVAAVGVVSRLRRSHIGRAWLAIRQDELSAKASGVEVVKHKLLAYMVGALWAGLAGVLFAAKQTIVSPTSFQFSQSFYVLSSVIIGGMGSIPGAILGGGLFILISESLQGITQNLSSIVFSLALLAVILLRPRGLWPASFHVREGARRAARASAALQGAAGTVAGTLGTIERVAEPTEKGPDSRARDGTPLLAATDVSVSFGGVQALREVSFSVWPAEIVSIIGPNGAGKTTLLNVVSGFVRPQAGRVEIEGRSVTRLRVDKRARLGVGRTFQTPRLLSTLSVIENVMQGGHPNFTTSAVAVALGTRRQRREESLAYEEAHELVSALGMASLANTLATQLSYGDRRRCEIARCLALHPRVILLDEPAAGMNARETDDLGRLLLRVRELGIALVLIEHDMALVRKVSDRVIALDRGGLVATGSVDAVLRHPAVVRSYLGA